MMTRSLVSRSIRSRFTSCRQLRHLSTSFAEIYRNSVSSIPVGGGEIVVGHVVGFRTPKLSSQFRMMDFGLKTEAPFSQRETPGASSVGDSVSSLLLALEDDFNEPVFDPDRRTELPVLLAERYRSLAKISNQTPQFLHGRISAFKRGGASVKVLGFDAFAPRHHVLAIKTPVVGSFYPFYLLSMVSTKRPGGTTLSPLDVSPVVSSYGGILFTLANLVGFESAWKESGGGSSKDRLAYLRLLTKLLVQKNSAARRILSQLSENFDSKPVSSVGRAISERYGRFRNDSSTYALRWLDRPDFPGIWQDIDNRSKATSQSRQATATVGRPLQRVNLTRNPRGNDDSGSERLQSDRTRDVAKRDISDETVQATRAFKSRRPVREDDSASRE